LQNGFASVASSHGAAPAPSRPAGARARPTSLRALAHPLRTRLLGLLRLDGPSTASRLGARVGESSGVTSYHLRQLEQYGFVAELPDKGTRRERWWQAQHQLTSWEPDELVDQPGGREANAAMQRLQVEAMGRELRAWLTAEQPREWAAVAGMSDYVLHLTPAQTRQVLEELYGVLDHWAAEHRQAGDGTAQVNVFTAAFPRSAS
jgi:DNA-binding transcriptional ArsR family regulator